MQATTCSICDEGFNETNKKPREMECQCIACEKCLNTMFKRTNMIVCLLHNYKSTKLVQELKKVEIKAQNLCKEHQLELKFICPKDNQLICSTCLTSNHNHEIILIQEKIKGLQEEIKTKLKLLQETMQLQNKRVAFNKGQQQVNKAKFAIRNKILEASEQILSQIMSIIQNYFSRQFSLFDNQEQQIQSNLQKVHNIQNKINEITQLEETTIDQCELKKQKIDNLQEHLLNQEQNQQEWNIQEYENQNICNNALQELYESELFQEQRKNRDSQNNNLEDRISSLNQTLTDYAQQLQSLTEEQRINKDKISQLNQENQKQAIYIQELLNQINNLQDKNQSMSKQTEELIYQNIQLNQAIQTKTQQIQELEQVKMIQSQQSKEQEEMIRNLQLNNNNLNLQLDLLSQQKTVQDQEIREQSKQIQNLTEKVELLSQLNEEREQIKIQLSQQKELLRQVILNQELKLYKSFEIITIRNNNKSSIQLTNYLRIKLNSNNIQSVNISVSPQTQTQSAVSNLQTLSDNDTSCYQTSNTQIILVGGYDQNRYIQNVLKIENNEIVNQSNLIFPRKRTSLSFDNLNIIYIIGGRDAQDNFINECEIYDIKNNKNTQISQHLYKGERYGTCYAYDMIFTFGGQFNINNSKQRKDYICFYDIISNK